MDLQENIKNEQSGREGLNMRESQENGRVDSYACHIHISILNKKKKNLG